MKILQQYSFYLLAVSVVLALILPVVLQDGMFMDGIQYACVSRNLAAGDGTFWFPWLNDSWMKAGSPYFMEHPPLVFGIQSVFFKVLGDTMYTERIYSVLTALISAFLIIRIWKVCNPGEKQPRGWIPVILWVVTPVCFWSYQNDMQENTLGVFTLWSVNLILKSVSSRSSHAYFYLVVAGLMIFAAFLCKGLPGLFPLGAVFLFYLVFRSISFSKMMVHSFILLLVSGGTLLAIYSFNQEAYNSLHFYFYERLAQRINEEPTVTNRFFILVSLLQELLPMIGLVLAVNIIRIKNLFTNRENTTHFLFFMLVGLSAALPLMLTPVQRGFYLVPAFPFFALGFAFLVKDTIDSWLGKLNEVWYRRLFYINFILLLTVLSVSIFVFAGKPGRDRDVLTDVYEIGEQVPVRSQLLCNEELYNQWNLHFYLTRYFRISLDYADKNQKYLLKGRHDKNPVGNEWQGTGLAVNEYLLFKRK